MTELEFHKNEDAFKLLCSRLDLKFAKVKQGGGEKRIAKQHKQGKLTARERIDFLIDKDSNFLEFGGFAGEGMYDEVGGCPSGGVVICIWSSMCDCGKRCHRKSRGMVSDYC